MIWTCNDAIFASLPFIQPDDTFPSTFDLRECNVVVVVVVR